MFRRARMGSLQVVTPSAGGTWMAVFVLETRPANPSTPNGPEPKAPRGLLPDANHSQGERERKRLGFRAKRKSVAWYGSGRLTCMNMHGPRCLLLPTSDAAAPRARNMLDRPLLDGSEFV